MCQRPVHDSSTSKVKGQAMSAQPVETHADVVVIGGGIVGVSAAYYLAKQKANVVLLEKGSIGNEQSSRAWGFVRQQRRDPAELGLVIEANKIWRNLSAELEADIEWVQGGVLTVAANDEQYERHESWLKSVKDFGVQTQMLSRQEVSNLIPDMRGSWVGGMYTPSDGHAEPTKVSLALARAAESLGATIYTDCPAQSIELSAGRVSGVVTPRGTIRTPIVICAAGAWSTRIARTIGIDLPQVAVLSTAAETEPVREITNTAVWSDGCALRQRPNGRVYIAGGARGQIDLTLDSLRYARYFVPNYLKNRRVFQMRAGTRLLRDIGEATGLRKGDRLPEYAQAGDSEPKPDMKIAQATVENFMALFPSLGHVRLRRVWAGWIDSTPDALPVLGEAGHVEGFVLATGFSGHGFAMGPIVGRLMSELITEGQTSVDISQLSYDRFSDGRLGPAKSLF